MCIRDSCKVPHDLIILSIHFTHTQPAVINEWIQWATGGKYSTSSSAAIEEMTSAVQPSSGIDFEEVDLTLDKPLSSMHVLAKGRKQGNY